MRRQRHQMTPPDARLDRCDCRVCLSGMVPWLGCVAWMGVTGILCLEHAYAEFDRRNFAEAIRILREAGDWRGLEGLAGNLDAKPEIWWAYQALIAALGLQMPAGDARRLQHRLDAMGPVDQWSMARRDSQRSSYMPRGAAAFHPVLQWVHQFQQPIPQGNYDVPSPVLAGDKVVVADVHANQFLALAVADGHLAWASGDLPGALTYSSTPACWRDTLFFTTGAVLQSLNHRQPGPVVNRLMGRPQIVEVPFCSPLATETHLVYGLQGHILVYDCEANNGCFIAIPPRDDGAADAVRAPVVCAQQVFVLTQRGRLFSFSPEDAAEDLHLVADVPIEGGCSCSAPCVLDDIIYFELVDAQSRIHLCTYDPRNAGDPWATLGLLGQNGMPEIGQQNAPQLCFSPVVCSNGVLTASATQASVHRVQRIFAVCADAPIHLDIQVGGLKVANVSNAFSTVAGSHLISKSGGNMVFWVDLNNPGASGLMRPPDEVLAQPVMSADYMFLLCRDGLRCYR